MGAVVAPIYFCTDQLTKLKIVSSLLTHNGTNKQIHNTTSKKVYL